MLLIYLNYFFIIKIYQNYNWINNNIFFENFCLFCYYLFSSFLFFCFMYAFSHVFAISFTSSCCMLLIFFVKIRQSFLQLVKLSNQRYSSLRYTKIRATYIHTLQYFFKINHDYGKLFLATIMIFAPVNAMMSMWITLGFVKLENNVFVAFFIFYHLYFIFVLHLFLTYCTRNIHRLSSVLIKLMVHSGHQVGEIRSRMILANDIFALHTTNR